MYKNLNYNFFILVFLVMINVSCSDKDQVAETAEKQSREQVGIQNQNIEEWSSILLLDLQARKDYIEGINGEYEGEFSLHNNEYGMKIIIASTFPIYNPERNRRIEEIVFELNNLDINVQILQWPIKSNNISTGCIFEKVRPDYKEGVIDVFSKSCGISYKIQLTSKEVEGQSENEEEEEEGTDVESKEADRRSQESRRLSRELLNSSVKKINKLKIQMQSNSLSQKAELIVERVR